MSSFVTFNSNFVTFNSNFVTFKTLILLPLTLILLPLTLILLPLSFQNFLKFRKLLLYNITLLQYKDYNIYTLTIGRGIFLFQIHLFDNKTDLSCY
jgi:hypothetical protein